MRGRLPDLVNPHPLVTGLPALYQDDDLTRRFLAVLDDHLAPLLTTMDTVDAYLDPALTPPDFLAWLAGWVGVELDENWSLPQQRRLVAVAVQLLQWRGTRRGMVDLIRHFLDLDAEDIDVEDSGGVAWSASPGGDVPGSVPATLRVRVRAADGATVDVQRLRRLVAEATPAHVRHDVEVVTT